MATITEKKNTKGDKVWQVRIRRRGYPPISRYFDSLQEARTQATLIEASVLKNENINPREATKWTIPEVFKWYRENPNPHRKLETKKHFQRLALLEEEFRSFTVATLTPKILSKWIQKRLEINAIPTVYHYYVALKNPLIYHSVQHDYSQNIFNVVKCPTKSGERDRRFSTEENRRLNKSIRARSKIKKKEMMVSVLFALNTSCRIGEMLKLQWREVSLKNKYVEFLAHNTKTQTYRRIPINKTAYKILLWLQKNYNPEKNKEKRVFEFWNVNEHHLSRQFQICCERAEINDIRWHDLRHEATSRLYEWVNPKTGATLTDMEIASITGHKSLSMLKKYSHLRPSTILPKMW